MRRSGCFLAGCFLCLAALAQDFQADVDAALRSYFKNYKVDGFRPSNPFTLQSYQLSKGDRKLTINANEMFAAQPFTPQSVETIYHDLRKILPPPFNTCTLRLFANNEPVEDLIPNYLRAKPESTRRWGDLLYTGAAWTKNLSKPYETKGGLTNKHLAIWGSHGKYYNMTSRRWSWQRPALYATVEDLFTQEIVASYLIPMLENSGAIVFTPRERDRQPHEIIVDNDSTAAGSYQELAGADEIITTTEKGFAHLEEVYTNGNPFRAGSARQMTASKQLREASKIIYTPAIPTAGPYAVYVSYQTTPLSVPDAKYTVRHKGVATEFSVNQQMGGSTWTYLGTFHFDEGQNSDNCVILSGHSDFRGVVTADAVRFGGGMGNVARGAEGAEVVSGLPRFWEGARYYAQWAGMPSEVYNGYQGKNDYNDDVNTRPLMVNYLNGGSLYNPFSAGAKIPIELALAVHSDAGYRADDGIFGSLSISTTNGTAFPAGVSRQTSRDLASILLDNLVTDLSAALGQQKWTRRERFDRNFSETRNPTIPSAIIETLSHQNFTDIKLGHDPHFKFLLARSIYKSLLKYVSFMHDEPYAVQPLPITHFSVQQASPEKIRLCWSPRIDGLEETSKPNAYIVYTRIGNGSFDNGVLVRNDTTCERTISNNVVYSFRVTAINDGGESFPSETLSAMLSSTHPQTILIVNGFHRLSAPAFVKNADSIGFLLDSDRGVPYFYTGSYIGRQLNFNRTQADKEAGLGNSEVSLERQTITGNTFDYPYLHGETVRQAGGYSFVSCSSECVREKQIRLEDFPVVDWICGLEKSDAQSLLHYETLAPAEQQLLTRYLRQNGRLFITGSYLGSGLNSSKEQTFTHSVLKYVSGGSEPNKESASLIGLGQQISFERECNGQTYAVQDPDILLPVAPAFTAFAYKDGGSAGIAYAGEDYRLIALGIPFESITDASTRTTVMRSVLHYLLK